MAEPKKKSSGTHTYTKNVVERIREKFLNSGVGSQYTKQSIYWFKNYITDNFVLRLNNTRNYLKNPVEMPVPGRLYMYAYDPKWKEKLQYYDTFPLIICLENYKDGFLGLNLHYVDPKVRAFILYTLLDTLNNKNFDDKTKFKINYMKLKQLSQLKGIYGGMIKRYLYSHVTTVISKVPADDWEIVIFLPLQNFKKASSSQVWKDNR